jgi:hypothetical protein
MWQPCQAYTGDGIRRGQIVRDRQAFSVRKGWTGALGCPRNPCQPRTVHPRFAMAPSYEAVDLERIPIGGNHPIDKNTLNINLLEHVLIGKVSQLFRNML